MVVGHLCSPLSPSTCLNQGGGNAPATPKSFLKTVHATAAAQQTPEPAELATNEPVTLEMFTQLQNELRQTQATGRALQLTNYHTHKRLERLAQLPQTEQSNLRNLLATARKTFDELKQQKDEMHKLVLKEREQGKERVAAERLKRKALEAHMETIWLELQSAKDLEDGDGALERERNRLQSEKVRAETVLAEVCEEVTEIDIGTQQVVCSLFTAMQQLEEDMLEAMHGQKEAEAKVDQTREISKLANNVSKEEGEGMEEKLAATELSNRQLMAEIEKVQAAMGIVA